MAKFQNKKRILKAAREKQEVTYKGAPRRLAADFSMETLQARREQEEIFQVMKTRGLQRDYFIQQDSQLKWKAK